MHQGAAKHIFVSLRISIVGFVLLATSLLGEVSLANAQRITASLVGTTRDSGAAVIPNAIVTVINSGTQVSTTAKTNDEGQFQLSSLPPGPYIITVDADGFKRLMRSG